MKQEENWKAGNKFHGLIRKVSLSHKNVHQIKPSIELQNLNQIDISEEFLFMHSLYELVKFEPKRHILHRSTVPLV